MNKHHKSDAFNKAIGFLALAVFVGLLISGCKNNDQASTLKSATTSEADLTYVQIKETAANLFQDFAKSNSIQKLEQGPCLGIINDQWAIDIAHSPRLASDNEPQNQCASFVNGSVKHLLEFNSRGQVITIK